MKMKTFVNAAAILSLLLCMVACEQKNNELPAAAGTITGNSENTCPVSVVTLTVDAIGHAASYQWYKNGAAIPDAVRSYYTVTESGTYTVAGINSNGSGLPSPGKAVNIVRCPMMERIIGEWEVIESIYQNTEEGWQGPVPNIHRVVISKVNETTVNIVGLYVTGENAITATVNFQTPGAETITIPTQEIIPSRYSDARTFVSPITTATFSEGYGQSFTLPVKDVSGRLLIELKGGYTLNDDYYSYVLGAVDAAGSYTGSAAYAVNTRWIKD